MTEIQTHPSAAVIEGPVRTHRFGSIGFRLDDRRAPFACRAAAAHLLREFGLTWVPDLADDVAVMVTELVTNAVLHARPLTKFPAGSLTVWHPNKWLVLTVHDKAPRTAAVTAPHPADMSWGVGEKGRRPGAIDWSSTSGRGLSMVQALALRHCGRLDWASDDDPVMPGKVARVKLLLPDVSWPHTFIDPHK
ncbi:ATP-binding protein [Streptomyces sp. NPDC001515]